jgi:hypothetical protein
MAECDDNGEFRIVDAGLSLVELSISGRRLTRVSGRVSKRAGSPLVRLDDLGADAYGGRLAGFAELVPGKPSKYGLSLTVENVQIDDVLNAGTEGPDRIEGMGRLAGTLQLTGDIGNEESRLASGVLHFTHAQTYRLPVLWGVLQVALLRLPGDSVFHSGTLSYHMKGNLMTLEEVYLSGLCSSILGSGTIQMPEGQIRLTFVSGPPKLVPPVISQLMQITTQGLLQIRVTGALRKPAIESRPLGNVNDLLNEMVTPK